MTGGALRLCCWTPRVRKSGVCAFPESFMERYRPARKRYEVLVQGAAPAGGVGVSLTFSFFLPCGAAR